MSRLEQAISWSGTTAELLIFASYPDANVRPLAPSTLALDAVTIDAYPLDDEAGCIGGSTLRTYDLVFPRVPENLEEIVISWLDAVSNAGAEFAWFAFDGSFGFDSIFTEDVARQVFAVVVAGQIELALDDDYRQGPAWSARLTQHRHSLGIDVCPRRQLPLT